MQIDQWEFVILAGAISFVQQSALLTGGGLLVLNQSIKPMDYKNYYTHVLPALSVMPPLAALQSIPIKPVYPFFCV